MASLCRAQALSSAIRRLSNQTTLKSSVSLSGVGLHGGLESHVNLLPANAKQGRFFVAKDEGGRDVIIPASLDSVCDTRLSTSLGKSGTIVHTVEHLLSSLEGLGVDNVRIEITGGNEVT